MREWFLQKQSSTFKQAWADFCALHGEGKNDPMRHDVSFHTSFFDQLAGGARGGANPMMMGGADENPLKRMRTWPSLRSPVFESNRACSECDLYCYGRYGTNPEAMDQSNCLRGRFF